MIIRSGWNSSLATAPAKEVLPQLRKKRPESADGAKAFDKCIAEIEASKDSPTLVTLKEFIARAGAAKEPRVVLGGEVGRAADACAARLRVAPFDSLPWLRADLTGEKVTEFDAQWGHILNRPFKDYSGDISGRFIEIMARDSRGDIAVHPALKGCLRPYRSISGPAVISAFGRNRLVEAH